MEESSNTVSQNQESLHDRDETRLWSQVWWVQVRISLSRHSSVSPPLRYSRSKVPSSFKRKGNEKRVWLESRRDCGFGNTGNMKPCSSKKCVLCNLVRSSVSKEVAQYGIRTTPSLARYLFDFQTQLPFLINSQSHWVLLTHPQNNIQGRRVGECPLRSRNWHDARRSWVCYWNSSAWIRICE